mmetsp:Transcript_26392/g.79144  ORF Transcript_26392/g.79144 Transcript_26392/m.79144 type:complete len:226 (-) Transcript_26392:26-703(-)
MRGSLLALWCLSRIHALRAPIRRSARPRDFAPRVQAPQSRALELRAETPAADGPIEPVAPEPTGLRARIKKLTSFKKKDLASLGVSAFFSYGFVSNVNSVLLLSFTWATYRRANPLLSPLSDAAVLMNPLTWLPLKKAFLVYYLGYYATIGSILRPVRFGVAIALAPTFEKIYGKISEKLGVPRAVSIFLFSMVTNVVFTIGLLLVAVNVFCAALRVAPVPLGLA